MKKKGQFKIQQMAFMLVAVILFFVLVAIFWITIQKQGLYEKATNLRERRAIKLANFLASSSEYNCPNQPGYCIDTDKLIVLKNRSTYRDYWPVTYIKVAEMYPADSEVGCSKANYPDCSTYNIYRNEEINSTSSISSYVALCRYKKIEGYSTKICELGKIIIGYEVEY